MLKFIKIEIQITALTLFIAAAVIASGYLVYNSLSLIIDSIHKEARPDYKLLLIKDVAADLNEIENTVRLYSLTGNENFIYSFHQQNKKVHGKLKNLEDYAIPGSIEIQQIDSIRVLSNRKLVLWAEIRNLHKQKIQEPITTPWTELYTKIDSTIIQPDTITFEKPKKKSWLKRIFAKQDTTTKEPIIIDKSEEKEQIKQEIAAIEQQISTKNQQLQINEKKLLEQNIAVTNSINRLISKLEQKEQRRLESKTEEADFMAAQIYRRLVLFTGTSILLLVIVLIIFFRNLRYNKAYQKLLLQARRDAENLAKAKERFVATVSHEMRTPVNAISGLSEQMLQRVDDPALKTDLNIVRKSADHLIALVNDTLDFSKAESYKMTFEQIDFSPVELLREVIILHEAIAKEKSLKLELQNDIPTDRVYKGDPIRLKQILINLLTNALKFTEKGTVQLSVSDEKIATGRFRLKVSVEDTGVGIQAENLNKIFDAFVQLDGSNAQKHRGAGLGLAIVKKLIDLQGGAIIVTSTVGKGSNFSFNIPYSIGSSEKIEQSSVSASIPAWFSQLHVLIVDDEEFNVHLLKNILQKWGATFSVATNGQEAATEFGLLPYDLILMDRRMPVMDGLEAAKIILASNPDANIIMLTATTTQEDEQSYKNTGIRTFLQKPFKEHDLVALIENMHSNFDLKSRAQTTQPTEPSFNLKEMIEALGGDEHFAREMLELFFVSAHKCKASMQAALEAKNREALIEATHKLAAPARHMMATTLHDCLKQIETTAENENWDRLTEMVENTQQQIDQFLQQLNV